MTNDSSPPRPDKPGGLLSVGTLTLLAFAVFILTNGSAPVAIRITFEEMTPLWSGGSRFALAGAIVWGLAAINRVPLPGGRLLRDTLVFGILSTGVSPILLLFGLANLPSSLYQTLLALIPLLTLFLATLHGQERITMRGLAGAGLAIAGTAVAVGAARGARISVLHVGIVIVGAASLAEAAVIARGLRTVHPMALNAIGLTVGGLIVLAVSRILGDPWAIPATARVWAAYLYTMIFAVVIGFLLYIVVLKRWTASATSYSFLLAPLVTAITASIIAGERITLIFAAGTGLVLAGVYIGAFTRKLAPAEASAVASK